MLACILVVNIVNIIVIQEETGTTEATEETQHKQTHNQATRKRMGMLCCVVHVEPPPKETRQSVLFLNGVCARRHILLVCNALPDTVFWHACGCAGFPGSFCLSVYHYSALESSSSVLPSASLLACHLTPFYLHKKNLSPFFPKQWDLAFTTYLRYFQHLY